MLPDYCQVSVEPPKFSSLPDKVPPFFLFFFNIRGEYFLCLHTIVISGDRFDIIVSFPLLKMELVFFLLLVLGFGFGFYCVEYCVFTLQANDFFLFSVNVTICSFILLLTMCSREKTTTTQIEKKKPKNT